MDHDYPAWWLEKRCPCELQQRGGEQFCVFCLRRLYDAAELRAAKAEARIAELEAEAALASQAPAMARRLAMLEWSGQGGSWYSPNQCPECTGISPERFDDAVRETGKSPWAPHVVPGHEKGCGVDAILTAAGLSAADREEVRAGKW